MCVCIFHLNILCCSRALVGFGLNQTISVPRVNGPARHYALSKSPFDSSRLFIYLIGSFLCLCYNWMALLFIHTHPLISSNEPTTSPIPTKYSVNFYSSLNVYMQSCKRLLNWMIYWRKHSILALLSIFQWCHIGYFWIHKFTRGLFYIFIYYLLLHYTCIIICR